jgi:hypothetical protein
MKRDWLWWSLVAAFSAMAMAFFMVLMIATHAGL